MLADAYIRFRRRIGTAPVRLEAAGYLAPGHGGYLTMCAARSQQAGLADEFSYRGALDRPGKLAFLRGLDVLSVPATYDEPKGMFLLEAMASGVPVVQPRRGGFVEIVEKTGGGLLVDFPGPSGPARQSRGPGRRAVPAVERSRLAAHLVGARVRGRARPLHDCSSRRAVCSRSTSRPQERIAVTLVRGLILVLQVSNVSKEYPTPRGSLSVLSDVTFSLAPGEAAAITGPSGSGKSSLLYVLGALEPPSAGSVTLGGRNPFTLGPSDLADFRNSEIGFVFQDHCLLPQCSVLENVLRADAGRHPQRRAAWSGPDGGAGDETRRAWPERSSNRSASPTGSITAPASSQAARSSASPSRAR